MIHIYTHIHIKGSKFLRPQTSYSGPLFQIQLFQRVHPQCLGAKLQTATAKPDNCHGPFHQTEKDLPTNPDPSNSLETSLMILSRKNRSSVNVSDSELSILWQYDILINSALKIAKKTRPMLDNLLSCSVSLSLSLSLSLLFQRLTKDMYIYIDIILYYLL